MENCKDIPNEIKMKLLETLLSALDEHTLERLKGLKKGVSVTKVESFGDEPDEGTPEEEMKDALEGMEEPEEDEGVDEKATEELSNHPNEPDTFGGFGPVKDRKSVDHMPVKKVEVVEIKKKKPSVWD